MNGKILAGIMGLIALATAIGVYYMQVYHYYEEVSSKGFALVTETGTLDTQATNIAAIDAISSPIRFRACFDTPLSPTADAVVYEKAVPLTAPGWFDCFDATAIGDALEAGTATAYLSEKNVEYGTDRIVAITDDGRGYVWHQLNNCGETAYDGTQIGEDCPPREDQ